LTSAKIIKKTMSLTSLSRCAATTYVGMHPGISTW